MTSSKVFIHFPGLGTKRTHAGFADSNTNGSAMPTPTAMKTSPPQIGGIFEAAPRAAPIPGPLQAVPSSVASTPVPNADQIDSPSALVASSPTTAGVKIVNTPNKDRAKANTTPAMAITTVGDWKS